MSILGIGHTIISVIALIVAAIAFIKTGAIVPYSTTGKLYSILNAVACVTSFGLLKHGFNPGHVLGILILLLLGLSYLFAKSNKPLLQYLVVFFMSATVFLSLVPATNETLSRLPVGHPIANGPASPAVQNTLKVILILFVTGVVLQFVRLRKRLRAVA